MLKASLDVLKTIITVYYMHMKKVNVRSSPWHAQSASEVVHVPMESSCLKPLWIYESRWLFLYDLKTNLRPGRGPGPSRSPGPSRGHGLGPGVTLAVNRSCPGRGFGFGTGPDLSFGFGVGLGTGPGCL